jgi:RNA polymerase sigma factor (sigma-70 family)
MNDWIDAVNRAQRGDAVAFGLLVRRFQDLAVGYAFSILGDRHHAEDAAQSAFLDAFQGLRGLEHPAAFPAWLRRIVFKYCDRQTRGRRARLSLDAARDVEAPNVDPHAAVAEPEERAWVRQTIFELPEPERTALVLYYFEERRQREIADFLEVPVSTVNNRIHTARQRLAERMTTMIERDLDGQRPSRDETFAEHLQELIQAISGGDATRVRVLLELDPELSRAHAEYDKTGLHWAAEKDRAEIAKVLIDAGADLQALTNWGMTPLEWAANMGQRAVGTVLIQRGMVPNLFSAAGLGLLEEVRGFFDDAGGLKPGAELVQTDALDGQHVHSTRPEDQGAAISLAEYVAARNGHTECVRVLLEHGADIDYRGFFGGTGLHWACINGHIETVRFLLARGANAALKDFRFDATAEGWASEGKHDAIVELLRGA